MRLTWNRHASDEDLIRWQDGECTSRQAETIHRHLLACWSCRRRNEQLREAVGLYVDARARLLEQVGSAPGNAPSFEDRLSRMAATIEPARRSNPLFRRCLVAAGLAAFVILSRAAPVREALLHLASQTYGRWGQTTGPAAFPALAIPPPAEVGGKPGVPSRSTPAGTVFAHRSPVLSHSHLGPNPLAVATEIEVHEVLHRLDACLGEEIEVSRVAEGWLVAGIVDSSMRVKEIEAALAQLPGVGPRLRSAGELPVGRTPERSTPAADTQHAAAPWMDAVLQRRFAALPELAAKEKARDVSEEVIAHAERVWRHGWALRRLTELPAHRDPRLYGMVRDHLRELEKSANRLHAAITGLPGPARESGGSRSKDWRTQTQRLFQLANTTYTGVMQVFARPAGTEPDMRAKEDALNRISASLLAQIGVVANALAQETARDQPTQQ